MFDPISCFPFSRFGRQQYFGSIARSSPCYGELLRSKNNKALKTR